VNTASRMASTAECGTIQLSAAALESLQDHEVDFEIEPLGVKTIKGKGFVW
jgi:class 3 adenylate cyclase